MSNVYPSPHPLVAHKLSPSARMDTEPKKFRQLVREMAALLAYEATADLATEPKTVRDAAGNGALAGAAGKDRPGADPARRAGHGGRHLGADALRRSLAHRPVPRRAHAQTGGVLQQAARSSRPCRSA